VEPCFTEKATGKVYILMEARVEALFKSPDLYEVLGSMFGKELKGKKYKPIFDYFANVRFDTILSIVIQNLPLFSSLNQRVLSKC
jgi:isoleucyl-tRNA synthetase